MLRLFSVTNWKISPYSTTFKTRAKEAHILKVNDWVGIKPNKMFRVVPKHGTLRNLLIQANVGFRLVFLLALILAVPTHHSSTQPCFSKSRKTPCYGTLRNFMLGFIPTQCCRIVSVCTFSGLKKSLFIE